MKKDYLEEGTMADSADLVVLGIINKLILLVN